MPASTYPMVVDQGSDYLLEIPVFNPDDDPIDVSSWSAAGQVRFDYQDDTVLHELSCSMEEFSVLVHIPSADSSAWTWRTARYDIEVIAPDGTRTRLLQGLIIVRPEVTR